MIVLALNCGSSSVKFHLYDVAQEQERSLAKGSFEGFSGRETRFTFQVDDVNEREDLLVHRQDDAIPSLLNRLAEPRTKLPAIEAVGHRVVHGGGRFSGPALIDSDVLRTLEDLEELAPLHNAPSLSGIRAAAKVLGPGIPMVAVFDTAFHASLPDRASYYAVPHDLARRHGIRRFGFHGISYQSVLSRYCEIVGIPVERANLVILHLGNGCSAAAIKAGRSVDTSMGFTPLEGLVMGTRSGDVDPAVVAYLARK